MSEIASAAEQLTSAKAVLFDWDGCLANGGALLPGARDLLRSLGRRAFILSNNSTDLPRDLRAFLAAERLDLEADHILLAGHQTLCRQAVAAIGQRVHLVANPAMTDFAAGLGIELAGEDADAVVVLRDTTLTFAKLEAAANAARRCRRVILANPDLTHPGVGGAVVPETGAVYAAIAACLTDVEIEVDVVGKPGPFLFQQALARARIAPGEAVMLGDNPATDGAGAQAAGIPFVLIQPGGAVDMASLAPAFVDLSSAVPPMRISR